MYQIVRLPKSVKWFLITELVYGFGLSIWNLTYNFHLKSNGFTQLGIGMLISFGSVVTCILSPLAGGLNDRLGFRMGMVFGCIIKGTGMLLVAFAPRYEFIYLGQMLFSIGNAFILSSEFPFILSLVDEEFKHVVYTLLIGIAQFGMIIGNLTAGFLIGNHVKASVPYLLPLALSGVFFVLIGIGRCLLSEKIDRGFSRKTDIFLLKEAGVIWFLLYGLLGSSAVNTFVLMLNIILSSKFNMGDVSVSRIFAVSSGAVFISAFLVPVIIKRVSNKRLATIVLALIVINFVVMSFSGIKVFVAGVVVNSFLCYILPGSVDSSMLQSVKESVQGTYSGMWVFATNIGVGIGGCLSGLLLTYTSYSVLLIMGAVITSAQLLVYSLKCKKYIAY
ncbi:MAG: MFS transporter [Ruminiclostridium sp.]